MISISFINLVIIDRFDCCYFFLIAFPMIGIIETINEHGIGDFTMKSMFRVQPDWAWWTTTIRFVWTFLSSMRLEWWWANSLPFIPEQRSSLNRHRSTRRNRSRLSWEKSVPWLMGPQRCGYETRTTSQELFDPLIILEKFLVDNQMTNNWRLIY